jgi:hypothetical protein
LSEKDKNNRPTLIEEVLVDLRESLPGLFTDLSSSGRAWFQGKAGQEKAKADQILADVLDKLGRLRLDEREQQHRHAIERERHDVDMQAKRLEQYVSALERAAAAARALSDLGVDVDMAAVLRGLPVRIDLVTVQAREEGVDQSSLSERRS